MRHLIFRIDTVYNKLRELIIGKRYTTDELAYYNKGNQLPSVLAINICTAIDSVLFPTIAKVQDNKDRVKELTRKSIQLSTFIIMPMMVGVAVCAEPIIRLLLTETWLPCVPYLRIACVSYAFYMVRTANLNAITAIGRSDIFPSTMTACFMGCFVAMINFLNLPDLIKLLIQIPAGIILYFIFSKVFKLWSLDYVCQLIRRKGSND